MEVATLFIIILLFGASTTGLNITEPPKSFIVFENRTANFTCKGDGEAVALRVNGSTYGALSSSTKKDWKYPQVVDYDGNIIYRLVILEAKREYNNTSITCVTGDIGGSSIESDIATLLIQGKIGPVTDLCIYEDNDELCWDPPFSLDVTGEDPDVWFTVNIMNITLLENIIAVSCNDCSKITDFCYNYNTDTKTCQTSRYNFTVSSHNALGNSTALLNKIGFWDDSCDVEIGSSDADSKPADSSSSYTVFIPFSAVAVIFIVFRGMILPSCL